MAKVEIKTNGIEGSVFVDGKEVPGVLGYSVSHRAGHLPSVQIDLLCTELTLDGNGAIPELPDIYKPFYESKPLTEEEFLPVERP